MNGDPRRALPDPDGVAGAHVVKPVVAVLAILLVAAVAAWFACEFDLPGGSECLIVGGVLGGLMGLIVG